MAETPPKSSGASDSNSSFSNMVHEATNFLVNENDDTKGTITNFLMNENDDTKGTISAVSVATGQLGATTPFGPTTSRSADYISPVETFSPMNYNEMTANPEELIPTRSAISGIHLATSDSPVVRNNFDFMSTSLVTSDKEDEDVIKGEEDELEAIEVIDDATTKGDLEKKEVIPPVDTVETVTTDSNDEQKTLVDRKDEKPTESVNTSISTPPRRLCRPAWLWIFVVLVLALAVVIAVMVASGMVDEEVTPSNSSSATGESNTLSGTNEATESPTISPAPTTSRPSGSPSESPTNTVMPSERPSFRPSGNPTAVPSRAPTGFPTVSVAPSDVPSGIPSDFPSDIPSEYPTSPSALPSFAPTEVPSVAPTNHPTTAAPTVSAAPTMESELLLIELLNNITDTPIEVLRDSSTPQGRALLWMTTEDEIVMELLQSAPTALIDADGVAVTQGVAVVLTDKGASVNYTSNITELTPPLTELATPTHSSAPEGLSREALMHLPQRYAVVALDISLHANMDALWSFPNLHECKWPGIKCDRSEEIISIDWARQDLKGYVVPEISLLTELRTLDLAQNQLTGFVDVFWNLPQLETLYLFDNQFMGSIGKEIENMWNLERLYLGNNQLTGSIPEELFDLNDLRYLILNKNNLTGSLPNRIRMNDLYYLDMSHNALNGTLPSNLRMPQLRHIRMEHNEFTGTIPEDYANLGSNRLFQFYFNDNKLTGQFPGNWHTRLPHKFLTNVDVTNNRFTQNIPDSVCKLTVYEDGETIEFRADCDVCRCGRLCYRWCNRDAKAWHNF